VFADRATCSERSVILDHVQLAMPEGREEEARAFFVGLLGMAEHAKPAELEGRGGCWFRSGGCSLHLGVDPDFRPQRKAHPALAVADVDGLADRLAGAGHEVRWDSALPGRRRFHSFDPFGNRLEVMEEASTPGERPRVGVGCIVVRSGRVLLVRSRSGLWSTPGGHLDFGETAAECALRETEEETGVHVADVGFVAITNDVFEDRGAHYVTIWMRGEALADEVVIGDTAEIAEAAWFDPESLPSPRHLYFENLIAGRCLPPRPENLPAFGTE
jgi:ADP-ribose pyrophosphatase YjhB (NUDIX family)